MPRGYHPLGRGGVPVAPKVILAQGLALHSGKNFGNNKGGKKTERREERIPVIKRLKTFSG